MRISHPEKVFQLRARTSKVGGRIAYLNIGPYVSRSRELLMEQSGRMTFIAIIGAKTFLLCTVSNAGLDE